MELLFQYEYFAGGKREPFGVLLRRLHTGLVKASLPSSFQFSFADRPDDRVSTVDRAVSKFPELSGLVFRSQMPEMAAPALIAKALTI